MRSCRRNRKILMSQGLVGAHYVNRRLDVGPRILHWRQGESSAPATRKEKAETIAPKRQEVYISSTTANLPAVCSSHCRSAQLAYDFGLRPLVVHFDNGWNTELAVANIESIVRRLGFEYGRNANE